MVAACEDIHLLIEERLGAEMAATSALVSRVKVMTWSLTLIVAFHDARLPQLGERDSGINHLSCFLASFVCSFSLTLMSLRSQLRGPCSSAGLDSVCK